MDPRSNSNSFGIREFIEGNRKIEIFVHCTLISICVLALVLLDLKGWIAAIIQIASAILGARLGSRFQHDKTAVMLKNHSRTSIRQIIDTMNTVGRCMSAIREIQQTLAQDAQSDRRILFARFATFLQRVDSDLETTQKSMDTAVQNWDILDKGSLDDVMDQYAKSDPRLSDQWRKIKGE